jgi:hypothetical protein
MFSSPTDIGKRVCQHLGNPLISTLGDNSVIAVNLSSIYDKSRQAELNAHIWRFATRVTALRPITSTSQILAFGNYASGTTYQQGDIVNDNTANAGNSGTALYISLVGSNLANTPSSSPTKWTPYFGPDYLDTYSASNNYYTGEIVYYASGSGTKFYLSLGNANINHTPSGGSPWTAAALVSGTTGTTVFIPYPIGFNNSNVSRSVYRLPVGYMRVAPQDPKISGGSNQTASAGMQYSDFQFEGNYLITATSPLPSVSNGPLIFRFCADISDVTQMNPQFCEALACRIAYDLCETVTQNSQLKKEIAERYDAILQSAWQDNLIELGSTDPKEMAYLTARNTAEVVGGPRLPQQGR